MLFCDISGEAFMLFCDTSEEAFMLFCDTSGEAFTSLETMIQTKLEPESSVFQIFLVTAVSSSIEPCTNHTCG